MATVIKPSSPLSGPLGSSKRSILLTGGASGLGLATVHPFASLNGAYITIATNIPVPGDTLSSLQASGAHVQSAICDVSDWDSLHATFKQALSFSPTGTVDVMAMFAGIDK